MFCLSYNQSPSKLFYNKLEIFNSKQQVQGSTAPRTSTLALPLSLAKQVGAGVNAITKSIADIQKDLYAIQDENEVNEIYLY